MVSIKIADVINPTVIVINSFGGVNGKKPSELTSFAIKEVIRKEFSFDKTILALFSPALLQHIYYLADFTQYPSHVVTTLFKNEIGVMGPIRFILDDSSYFIDNKISSPSDSHSIHSTIMLEWENGKCGDKIIDLRSTT